MNIITDSKGIEWVEKDSLILGDCLNIMPKIENSSVDMILCDLHYGRTQNKLYAVIPFDKL